jgi:hypothetical protein
MTSNRLSMADPDRDARRDLGVALATVELHQASIRHADTKTIALIGVLGGLTTAAIDRLVGVHELATGPAVASIGLALTLLGGLGMAARHLWRAMWPRFGTPSSVNRFAFSPDSSPRRPPSPRDVERQRAEAWDLVSVLAGIARAKHEGVRAALPWLAMCAGSCTALVVLDVGSRVAG